MTASLSKVLYHPYPFENRADISYLKGLFKERISICSLEALLLAGAIFKYQNIVFWPNTLVILRPLHVARNKKFSPNQQVVIIAVKTCI